MPPLLVRPLRRSTVCPRCWLPKTRSLGHRLAESTAALIVSLADDYEHIVAPATTDAKNVMPRVAALLDVMVISDASGVVDGSTFERPIYAGNAIQTVKSNDAKKVVTIRTATFDAAGEGGSAPVETVSVPGDEPEGLSSWVEDKVAESDRPELTSAGVVVSGGRGVGSEEDFKLIETLADKLGAAVGASRAAVDSGYAPNDWQVGQTGKVVAPESVCRCRHLGRDPAPCGYERLEGHRCDQQRRRSADLPGRRFRSGRRPVPGRAGTDREARLIPGVRIFFESSRKGPPSRRAFSIQVPDWRQSVRLRWIYAPPDQSCVPPWLLQRPEQHILKLVRLSGHGD